MKLQMEVTNLKELRSAFRTLEGLVVSPQAGIADDISRAIENSIVPAVRTRIAHTFKNRTGALARSVRARKVNQFRVDISVDAPYAAVHEYGGTFRITARQRRFFWAKYMEQIGGFWWARGEKEALKSMWLALALSETYTIPARPYLRPALDATRHEAMSLAASYLETRIKRVFK